jgi:hypothetical protein
VVPEDAVGGLYVRYTLRDYFPKFPEGREWIPGKGPFEAPEQWHGAPMAAIRRGIQAIGNIVVARNLPPEVLEALEELKRLYMRQPEVPNPADDAYTDAAPGPDHGRSARPEDDPGPSDGPGSAGTGEAVAEQCRTQPIPQYQYAMDSCGVPLQGIQRVRSPTEASPPPLIHDHSPTPSLESASSPALPQRPTARLPKRRNPPPLAPLPSKRLDLWKWAPESNSEDKVIRWQEDTLREHGTDG